MLLVVLISLCQASFATEKVVKVKSATGYAHTRQMNIDDLKAEAGIIFRGEFIDFRLVEENSINKRKLKFRVKDPILGIDSDKKILFLDEWAQAKSPFTENEIAKAYDYVFFFHKPSKIGLTSLIGTEQGAIKLIDKTHLEYPQRLSMTRKQKKTLFSFFQRQKKLELNNYQELREFCKK